MKKLLELAEKNMEKCPWVRAQTSEEHLKKLLSEVEELKAAYSKQDWNEAGEELGDLLWDTLILAYIMEKEKKIKASAVARGMREKISRRKPYLLSNKTITFEESVRIWKENKKKEKEERRYK